MSEIFLPECVAGQTQDCYTDNYFSWGGEKIQIVAPNGDSVATVWVRDTGEGYATGAWYGVEFTSTTGDDVVALATTGGELAMGIAGLFVAALLISAGTILIRGRKGRR